jgi:deoxyribonuclease V
MHERLVLVWDNRIVNTIGGVDVSYVGSSVCAAIAVLRFPELIPLSAVIGEAPITFPYIPGLLAYHVGPAILTAWGQLPSKPDLIMFHGHGIAHPRGMGLASHLGLWLDIQTIGVAKTHLYGYQSEPGLQVGEYTKLLDERNHKSIIGAVLRTRLNTRPIYVSAGHLIDLQHSIAFVLACCREHRMPEPIRAAHQVASSTQSSSSARLNKF